MSSPSQSLVDIVTTTFQAVLAVCVIFTAGYAYTGKNGATISSVSPLPANPLLPLAAITAYPY